MKSKLRSDLLDNRIIDLIGYDQDNNAKIYFLHAPKSPPGTYIEYEIYDDDGKLFAENEVQAITYYIQVDIFSPGDYSEVETTVKEVFKEKGYNYSYHCPDLYEKDTRLYHKPLRFTFTDHI